MMVATRRLMVFVCVVCVFVSSFAFATAAEKSRKPVVITDASETEPEEENVIKIVDYYDKLYNDASVVSGAFSISLKSDLKQCDKRKIEFTGETEPKVLYDFTEILKSTKKLTENLLRPMGAGKMDNKIKEIKNALNIKENKNVNFELLIALNEMTVKPEAVETSITAVNESLNKVKEISKLFKEEKGKISEEELSKNKLCNHTLSLLEENLEGALAALKSIKTEAGKATEWQDEFFAKVGLWLAAEKDKKLTKTDVGNENGPQQTVKETKDELQLVEEKQKNGLQQEQQSLPGGKNDTSESLSFDGSVAVGFQNSVFFFVFVFVTVSAVIAGV